eukprot:3329103-Rhodomonas_salina.1
MIEWIRFSSGCLLNSCLQPSRQDACSSSHSAMSAVFLENAAYPTWRLAMIFCGKATPDPRTAPDPASIAPRLQMRGRSSGSRTERSHASQTALSCLAGARRSLSLPLSRGSKIPKLRPCSTAEP